MLQTKRTEMTTTAEAIDDARVPWSTIFEEISLVIPENVRLQSLTCAVPADMLPGAAAAEAAGGELAADITFTGQTYEHKDVAEFMTRLGLHAAAHEHPALELHEGGRDGHDDRHDHAVSSPPSP